MPRPKPFKEILPKQRRTIPIPATDGSSGRERIDKGNLYRCWHCGFVCDVRRDELTDEGRHGARNRIFDGIEPYGPYQRGATAIQLDPGVGHDTVLMEQGPGGEERTIYQNRTVEIQGGCPLCGTKAWKK